MSIRKMNLISTEGLANIKITDLVGQCLGYCVFLLAVVVACVYGLGRSCKTRAKSSRLINKVDFVCLLSMISTVCVRMGLGFTITQVVDMSVTWLAFSEAFPWAL